VAVPTDRGHRGARLQPDGAEPAAAEAWLPGHRSQQGGRRQGLVEGQGPRQGEPTQHKPSYSADNASEGK